MKINLHWLIKQVILLALAENTLEEIEQTKFFQLFENDKKVTAVYFKEEFNELEMLCKKS
jgi:adenine-specific DNA-methyltransferase